MGGGLACPMPAMGLRVGHADTMACPYIVTGAASEFAAGG